jgi:hypothetical protein
LKPDESGGSSEFVVIKKSGNLDPNNPKSENFGLSGVQEAYKGFWGGTMWRLKMTIQSPVKLLNGHYY